MAIAQPNYWLQVESHNDVRDARKRARFFAQKFPDVKAYRTNTGWHAIVIGPMSLSDAEFELEKLRSRGRIPDDSFIVDGTIHKGQVWPVVTVAAPVQGPELRALTDADFFDGGTPDAAKVALGQMLFWDKILSGNKNISCASCHHGLAGTGDGLALPIGEGGVGLGVTRVAGPHRTGAEERVPRNAPPLYNKGALEFTIMFHDGRLFADKTEPSGFRNPAGSALPTGLDNALAAQAMFPVTSPAEMAGNKGENPIADAAAAKNLAGQDGIWAQLAERLQAIPQYVIMFDAAFTNVTNSSDITFVHAANAIAAYEATAFRADNSPFDRYLNGDRRALSGDAEDGMALFYGEAQCSECHTGALQTDLEFHAIGIPQIGPGKGDGLQGLDDFGREQVTEDKADRYKFITPSLRNVALTGPWGHDGAYGTLRAIVEHHLDPVRGLHSYDPGQLALPSFGAKIDATDLVILRDKRALSASIELEPRVLQDEQIDDLMAFLHALTNESSLDLRATIPAAVPSGLPVAD